MLPKVRRVSSMIRKRQKQIMNGTNKQETLSDRISNRSHSSSNKSTDDVYIETLLYIVHVDDIEIPIVNDESQSFYEVDDEQMPISSNKMIRRLSKRTTASFNENHRRQDTSINQTLPEPIYSRPSFSFTNPLRRLNSLIRPNDKSQSNISTPKFRESPLCSSTAKKSSILSKNQHNLKNDKNAQLFPPPPPCFLYDNPITTLEDKSVIRARGPGLTDGLANQTCYFDLDAPNAELQKLVIAIDGPSKADIQIDIIDKGVYRVFYICQLPGFYKIALTYDGVNIEGSPYHLRLKAPTSPEQIVPPAVPPPPPPLTMDSPLVTIHPVEFYVVNSPCIVTVRPHTSCTIFQAYIQSPQSNINLPITVHKSAKSESYEIYFIPTICGNHWLHVSLNQTPVADNPHRLIVRSYSSSKSIAASGQGLFHAYTGETSQFFVSKSPNDPNIRKGAFSVGISGPATVFLDANETEHGYEFNYKPTRSGKYLITIKNAGKHIQGSPFICRVHNKLCENRTLLSPTYEIDNDLATETATGTTTQVTTSSNSLTGLQAAKKPLTTSTDSANHVDLDIIRSSMSADASQVCVFGTGLYEAKPRRKASFKVDASQTGPGLLLVGLYSPVGPCERIVVKRIMPASPGFIYKVSYRARARGQYMLVILYGANMQHVPGSPYLVTVE